MQISLNTSKWWQNAWAALIFFTRLPLWRIYEPPRECYRAVVEFWPLAGWLTGLTMGAILYLGPMVMPPALAVAAAIVARLLLTGALHEDGLADFFDGFGGGGSNRERILSIMKDSRIGTYGVLSLIAYFAILFICLYSMPTRTAAFLVVAADPFAKMLAPGPASRYSVAAVGRTDGVGAMADFRPLPHDVRSLPENLAHPARVHRRLLRSHIPSC